MRGSAGCALALCAILCGARSVPAQTPQSPADPSAATLKNDTNPTRPVLFSLRPEFYHPSAEVTQAALIVRYDQASLRQRRWLPGRRGVILRFELPLAVTSVDDATTQAGLGDAYVQLLVAPYFTRTFAVVVGTGLLAPTASGDLLGTGKWVLAPAAGPVWFFPGRGMVFVKVQHLVSVAGNAQRSDLNALLVTPTIIHTVGERWWVLADSETKTNRLSGRTRTGVKSGLQLGRSLATGFGVWVKPELFWGPNRDGGWNLKFGMVWYR
jgi:hypothetical protein